jgi:hypothetical protein
VSTEEPPGSLFLHSTWTTIIGSAFGAFVMTGFAGLLLVDTGWNLLSGLMSAVALALVALVLFEMPVSSEFTTEGVTRRSIARHHHLAWEDLTAVRRLRMGFIGSRERSRGGGLVAQRGRRTHALVDSMESTEEFEAFRKLLGDYTDDLRMHEVRKPPEGRPPTWLYRRSKWKPESATSKSRTGERRR